MSYSKSNLMKDEVIVYETRLHWIIFFWGSLFIVFAILAAIGSAAESDSSGFKAIAIFAIFGLVLFISELINYITSEFCITNMRLIMKTGFIRRRTIEMLLQKVESISLTQGILGRIVGYGTIVITGTGGTPQKFVNVNKPLEFRNKAQEQLSKTVEQKMISSDKMNNSNSLIDLEKLSELKTKGIITEEEFTQKKRMMLGL